jgi:hypothetical protein
MYKKKYDLILNEYENVLEDNNILKSNTQIIIKQNENQIRNMADNFTDIMNTHRQTEKDQIRISSERINNFIVIYKELLESYPNSNIIDESQNMRRYQFPQLARSINDPKK